MSAYVCLLGVCAWRTGLMESLLGHLRLPRARWKQRKTKQNTELAADLTACRIMAWTHGRWSGYWTRPSKQRRPVTPSCAPSAPPRILIVPGFTHMHINMQHTLSCSSAPRATAPCAAPRSVPLLLTPHSRAHSLSVGWSCRRGGSPADRGPPSARGPCRGSAMPTTTATTGACCPATGNKTSPGSRLRSESRWRWPVSCAWWAHTEGSGGEPGCSRPSAAEGAASPPVMGWTAAQADSLYLSA